MRFIKRKFAYRRFVEGLLLACAALIGMLGFALVSLAEKVQNSLDPLQGLGVSLIPVIVTGLIWLAVHLFLEFRGKRTDQIILPVTALIFNTGLTMIYR